LAQRFLDRCADETKVPGPSRFAPGAIARLEEGDYPGNLRELHGVVESAYLMAAAAGAGEVRAEHLPDELGPQLLYQRRGDRVANRRAVERALERTGGNVTAAARVLGVSRAAVNAVLSVRGERQARGVGDGPGGNVQGRDG
jgi:DNA-binding NtrC family response regulator